MRRLSSSAVILAMTLAAVAGCTKVNKPTADSTPPTLTWHVENLTTSTTVDIAGSGQVNAAGGDDFHITLTAADPEGIHKITYGGGYTRSCVNGNLGQSGEGDFAGQTQDLEPDAQNKVLTSIFLLDTVNPDITCSGIGYVWKGTTITLVGSGTNYFSGVTNGTLTIDVHP